MSAEQQAEFIICMSAWIQHTAHHACNTWKLHIFAISWDIANIVCWDGRLLRSPED